MARDKPFRNQMPGARMDSSQDFITGGSMAVTSTHTDIPGMSRSITSPGTSAVWIVTFSGWLLCGTTAYTTLVELNVSGTGGGVQPGNAIMSGNPTGSTCSQTWRVTGLSAGAHTFKCVAFTNAVGQTGTVAGTHSSMIIERKA